MGLSFLVVAGFSQRFFRLCLAAGLLSLLASPIARAQKAGDPSSPPLAESPTNNESLKKNATKGKYDINRIGQRGIGHGFNVYSIRREHELGQRLAASFDRTTKIVRDEFVNDYINRLAQRIIGNSDAEVPFTIKVIDSGDIPRAYGLPGGFLYVDSALILSADSEAELAGVMAHEIAHVAARHATRALTRKHMMDIVDSMAMFAGPAGLAVEDAGGFAGPLSVKKFSRDSEYEADLLGMEYAYAAGYDPQALMDALEKLHAMEVKRSANLAKVPGYHFASRLPFHSKIARSFANYPLTEERIVRLQSEISSFLPGRKDYILDTNEFEEVKARLLESDRPVLQHHSGDDNDSKGPVLRRTQDDDVPNVGTPPPSFAFLAK